jgi:hypothetical protein
MLYLGSSLYVCWEEMGRPELRSAWMSAYRLRDDQKLRVLDFGYRPGFIAALLDATGSPASASQMADYAASYATTWPLIAACSFTARHRDAPFVEEYVLPQLLMSWLTESHEFIGVRYFSTHVLTPAAGPVSRNLVLPARGNADNGYSPDLLALLQSTAPIAWEFADAVGAAGNPLIAHSGALLEPVKDVGVPYEASRFALMEARLGQFPFGPIV